jgi:Domain of unknown function (DUF4411)
VAIQIVQVLDTNVFIEAAKRYYDFDIAPGFWESLITWARQGHIISIDRVHTEIRVGADRLARWTDAEFAFAFASTAEPAVMTAYGQIINWVQIHAQFTVQAKADFAGIADGWLVAFAMAHPGYIVVTEEVLDPNVRRKVPIPNICNQFNVQFRDTFAMLRSLNLRLRV